ncbi:MAG: peptide deformylase [Candidatus Woesearchaeota archaeon]
MRKSRLARKYNARPAIAFEHPYWVFSVAKRVDIHDSNEKTLVKDLSDLMTEARDLYGWVGISSNNLMWNATKMPIRVIQVLAPEGGDYLTLTNPELKEICGEKFESHEGCGSFPGRMYWVQRYPYVRLVGIQLYHAKFEQIELIYGAKDVKLEWPECCVNEKLQPVRVVQHECDHLEAIVIPKLAYSMNRNQNKYK